MTSSLPVEELRVNFKNIFGRTIYPSSLIVITFILAKLWNGAGQISGPSRQNNPILDRVSGVCLDDVLSKKGRLDA